MAIRSVTNIVRGKLPFLTDADDVTAEAYRVEMCYLLQTETGKTDGEVETEANYKSLENMLFADMVAYNMGQDQVAKVTGGSNGAAPTNKVLKRAKADVVETEFQIVKSSDGASFAIPTKEWFSSLLKDICDKSRALEISNPMCWKDKEYTPDISFITGEDFPSTTEDPYDLFNKRTIG